MDWYDGKVAICYRYENTDDRVPTLKSTGYAATPSTLYDCLHVSQYI